MANNKSYTIKLGVGYDAEIIGKLESVKNKSSYIKDLIRKDIAGELKAVGAFTNDAENIAKQYNSITEEKYPEQFNKNMEKSVNFITNTSKDTDVIDKLSLMKNKSEYVRRLILMDIGLVNQDGERYVLLDENGNAKSEKRTLSEQRKEREKGYNIGEEARFNQQKYITNYIKENYHQVMVKMRDNIFKDMMQHIQETNENRTEFIKRAITETIERDNNKQH